ncbi:MAG: hypothetical protein E5W93_06095 [Mesorhizobium sp.]|nr:MAG: hypothetical protein E5W93_06095 [Mesorhizobium sp.]
MVPTRLLCAIGLGFLACPSHAEEILDAAELYKTICIASNGDLLKGEKLALANGFSERSSGEGTFVREGSKDHSLPLIYFKPAESDTNPSPLDVCEVVGHTKQLADIEKFAQSRSLIEVPKEEVFGDLADRNYVRIFRSKECETSTSGDGACLLVEAIGDMPVDNEFGGVFRFGINSAHHVVGAE